MSNRLSVVKATRHTYVSSAFIAFCTAFSAQQQPKRMNIVFDHLINLNRVRVCLRGALHRDRENIFHFVVLTHFR